MNFNQLIAALKKDQVTLSVRDDKLQVKTQGGPLSGEQVSAIKNHKQALIDWCLSQNRLTPSDFACADVSQKQLDDIQKQYPNIENLYIATPMQEGLLFHAMLDGTNTFYTMQVNFDFNGELNVEAFKAAWQTLINRHSVFRTAFCGFDSEQIHQVVEKNLEVPFELVDFTEVENQAEKVAEFEQQDRLKGFDFAKAPLLRVSLIKLADNKHHLCLSYHHVLLDGWCVPIVFAELMQAYNQLKEGKTVTLPAVAPYENYISWLYGKTKKRAGEFWQQYLKGFDSPVPFLTCPYDSSMRETGKIGEHCVHLNQDTTRALEAMAKRHQCTVNNLLQLAWGYCISRFTGEKDVVFGTTISGRPGDIANVEQMVGLFINTIPLRLQLTDDATIEQMLEVLKTEGLDREEFGFMSLADIQAGSEVDSHTPLFDNLLVFENYPVDESINEASGGDGSDVAIENTEFVEQNNYPFTIMAHCQDVLSLTANYQSSLFAPQTIEAVLNQLKDILEALAARQGTELVNSLKFAELEFKDIHKSAGTPPIAIHQQFESMAAQSPNAIAVEMAGMKLTYAELNAKTNRLAHALVEMEVESGEHIGVYLPNSIEAIIAILAVAKAGCTYIPLDTSQGANRVEQIIRDSGSEIVLLDSKGMSGFNLADVDVIVLESVLEDSWFNEYSSENTDVELATSTALYVLYTSGSTGTPKGVVVSHDNVRHYLGHCIANYLDNDPKGAVVATPLSFDATVTSVFLPLTTGKTVKLLNLESQLIEQLGAELIDAAHPWLFKLTPAHLYAANELLGEGLSSDFAHTLIIGGEALSKQVLSAWKGKRLPNATMVNEYGPTEATVGCIVEFVKTQEDLNNILNLNNVPVGLPIGNTTVQILDAEGREQPINTVGELYIGGPGVTQGYLNRPEQTEKAFVNGLYRTGDRVRRLPCGRIDYIGRNDTQVKVRGFRIELGEIEAKLLAHSDVSAAVVLVEGEGAEANLKAFVATKVDVAGFKAWLKPHLPEYMIPADIIAVEQMPLTKNGKVDKKALLDIKPEKVQKTTTTKVRKSSKNNGAVADKLANIWREVLKKDGFGLNDSFFEIGGNSLLAIKLLKKLEGDYPQLILTDLFTYPSVNALAGYLAGDEVEEVVEVQQVATRSSEIAIIGMAGRFPDADNVDAFWQNMVEGKESLQQFSDEQLLEAGVPQSALDDEDYVKSGVLLNDIDQFDADFFDFSVREAQITDPQHRLLLECATEALENAGYGNKQQARNVAVYLGVGTSNYLVGNLLGSAELTSAVGIKALMHANDKDYAATRLAYKLNLTGQAVNVNTACSTSLVALHLACQALREGDSQMALVGGASISLLAPEGYAYEQGGIHSKDGHCRPFDSQATGTRYGSGAGLVLLKPLDQALEDGDKIDAVIKASAINNDGANKVGYTAPGVEGQASVIRKAYANAGISPDSVQYVETHGTATQIGDPIEVRALNNVFGGSGNKQSCALGAVKANIGHLDTAAGIAGLIKTVMALKTRQLPPAVNFNQANPEIGIDNTPFYLNNVAKPWEIAQGQHRRAGVSSFGIGGTNAHVVLEEAPQVERMVNPAKQNNLHLLAVSAKDLAALYKAEQNIAAFVEDKTQADLKDAAYTLNVGRTEFNHRSFSLVGGAEKIQFKRNSVNSAHKPVFLFPGQGTHHIGMAKEVYDAEPLFKAQLDECAALIKAQMNEDIVEVLYGKGEFDEIEARSRREKLSQTVIAQPCLFAIEYSLAKLWQSWGVEPSMMMGHSLGEYVAACLAGVFSLEDAIKIICARAKLMQQMPQGSMLSVPMAQGDIESAVEQSGCSLAAVNAQSICVVAGSEQNITEFKRLIGDKAEDCVALHTSHAFHSHMMDGVLKDFTQVLETIELSDPQLPIVSNLTGKLIENGEMTKPEYWAQHLRQTVQFHQGVEHILSQGDIQFIEMGPGITLSKLVNRHRSTQRFVTATSLPHPLEQKNALATLYKTLGSVWATGQTIDWQQFHHQTGAKRTAVPTYPFNRKTYWIDRQGKAVAVESDSKNNHRENTMNASFVAPQSELQKALAETWSQVLGINDIGIHDNFFELGGDSFVAVRLLNLIRKQFDSGEREMSVKQFFEHPTVDALAQGIEADQERAKRQQLQQQIAQSEECVEEGEI